MGMLSISHPDIWDFIHAKEDLNRWQNMNVSVQVTDEWMKKVIEDPGARHVVYHPEWGAGYLYRNSTGIVHAVKALECPEDTGGTVVTVGELFDTICKRAHSTGEPGLAFWDRIEKDVTKWKG